MVYSSFSILWLESLMGNEILTWSFQYMLLPECHNIHIRNQIHIFYCDINHAITSVRQILLWTYKRTQATIGCRMQSPILLPGALSLTFAQVLIDYEQSFVQSWSIEQNARDTQMTTRVTEGARQESNSRLRRSTLARACTPLTKSEEKLLAV